MRVLMVLANMGGTDRPAVWAQRQIESLNRLGIETETYLFKNRKSIPGLLRGGLAVRRMAREFQADLVHVHFGAAQALMAVIFGDKPVIISFCGSDLLGNYNAAGRKTWSGRLSTILSCVAALGCQHAIAKTEELKFTLWPPFLHKKCEVIPNGVDLEFFRPIPQANARAALGWNQAPVVLFMDRKGAWVKDPSLAYAAYGEAKKRVKNLRLHVIEHEPPDRMTLLYNAADALILTSLHEGSNNTIKEALACNLPVVATACGDTQERLKNVSLSFICSRDPHVLGERLAFVTALRKRSDGRQYVRELALDRVAKQIKTLYEQALAGTSPCKTLSVRCE